MIKFNLDMITQLDPSVSDQSSFSSPGGGTRDSDASPPTTPIGAAQIQEVPPNASHKAKCFAVTLVFPDL